MLILLAAALAAPQPGSLKTFGDWTVGCDNGLACQAVALFPDPGFEGGSLAIKRGPELSAVPKIWVTARAEGGEELTATALVIDGRSFALANDSISGNFAPKPADIAALLSQATRMSLLAADGSVLGSVSTSGSAAALLYIDAQQRRTGTASALVRRGAETRVPPPPPLPVIAAPRAPNRPPRTLTEARVRQLLGREATDCDHAQKLQIETARLDARTSLVLAQHPCGNGAYNGMASAFLVDEQGRPRRAQYDYGQGMIDGYDALVGAGWVPETRALVTFAKGRGLGDCGTGQDYAWDGARFRLIDQRVMGECRGSLDYITTWRARVVTR